MDTVDQTNGQDGGKTRYVAGRVIAAVVAVVVALWVLTYAINFVLGPPTETAMNEVPMAAPVEKIAPAVPETKPPAASSAVSGTDYATDRPRSVESSAPAPLAASAAESRHEATPAPMEKTVATAVPAAPAAAEPAPAAAKPAASTQPASPHAAPAQPGPVTGQNAPDAAHGRQPVNTAAAPESPTASSRTQALGVALVDAIIEPLEYELKDRFWGWRPNDIIDITDNVNNYQLGVLEVTRRAITQLAQRISRTGTTDAFDRNLENAMSWIMTKATDYWFPSPETKYEESLDELRTYRAKLINGNGYFYTRADNLIPLLEVFEDLLGSCDQNLVKVTEADGTKVGFFTADDYFYYAKGVAHAMAVILEGVQIDFSKTMENRRSSELLHHAIESCRRAAELEPWIVTNAALDGILANHRANMAAPISHARYYLGQLIYTLST